MGLACFVDRTPRAAVPVTPLAADELAPWLAGQAAPARSWVEGTGFRAEAGSVALVPGPGGAPARVLVGTGSGADDPWTYAALPDAVPEGVYRLDAGEAKPRPGWKARAVLGWALGAYAFTRYKGPHKGAAKRPPRLARPRDPDCAAAARAAEATYLVRDLVNTPAADMGPAELARAARDLARRHDARCAVTVGRALVERNYPAIYAVGRASARAPRLIDLRWGRRGAPRVSLVGKGVCFDSGGLDLKPAAAMKLMKKDMGGAAHALGLAHMIMAAGLDVRLRVLIPAVENAVAGDAMRPLDVVRTRKGLTVEIGHTDAEGRVVLADALAEACREKPAVLLDFATLTGAARVALGPDLPALFANDDGLADRLLRAGERAADPLWRLPLWRPYRRLIEGRTADLTNAGEDGFAGAIAAALFLEAFVDAEIPWAHLDIFAWNRTSRPGRPEGGEAMGLRAAFASLAEQFG